MQCTYHTVLYIIIIKGFKASDDIKTKTFSEAGNLVYDIHIDLMEGLSFKYRIVGNYSWSAKFPV